MMQAAPLSLRLRSKPRYCPDDLSDSAVLRTYNGARGASDLVSSHMPREGTPWKRPLICAAKRRSVCDSPNTALTHWSLITCEARLPTTIHAPFGPRTSFRLTELWARGFSDATVRPPCCN